MKRLIISLIACVLASCSYQRVGNLTMVSTRNVDSSKEYVELKRTVEGKSKLRKENALEEAINDAVMSVNGGEYMTNVVVYIKGDRVIKVVGDVYGSSDGKTIVSDEAKLSPGQIVHWIDDKNRKVKAEIVSVEGQTVNIKLVHNGKPYTTTQQRIIN